ncbi:MAG: hypothetical protein PHP25_04555 [Candidatus Moranbacteria bacterium]|nr:hypothetical protein [Candidatus Moranbacteria bacterium]
MKQRSAKKRWGRRNFEISFWLLIAVLFVVAGKASFGAKAQELIPVVPDSASATEEISVSADQLLGALQDGGLLANGNLGIKKSNLPETVADSQPVAEPNQPVQESGSAGDPEKINSDTFEYFEAQGGLVAGAATAKNDSGQPTIFKLAAKFLDEVVFKNSTEFSKKAKFDDGFQVAGQPVFNQDTAGYAIIKKGNQSVEVQFGKKYKDTPVVTASLSVQQYDDPEVRKAAEDLLLITDLKYVVTNVTPEGFEIMMDSEALSDIPFSWHALAVQDPNVFKKEAKDRNSNDSQKGDSGLSVGADKSKSSDSIMGIIGQSTDSSSLPPAANASQNALPNNTPGNNSSP